ncbi:hypothetical protein EGW08_010947 [Elysia chlorotica]|uniref:Uncharacterized protein n=1 Tax=Elysia chlorotica TaxID=188477 RepID=A0A433TIB2_ELYCH|nr:hypothetical protein EGW08_010947 [Elysia chlorotica]
MMSIILEDDDFTTPSLFPEGTLVIKTWGPEAMKVTHRILQRQLAALTGAPPSTINVWRQEDPKRWFSVGPPQLHGTEGNSYTRDKAPSSWSRSLAGKQSAATAEQRTIGLTNAEKKQHHKELASPQKTYAQALGEAATAAPPPPSDLSADDEDEEKNSQGWTTVQPRRKRRRRGPTPPEDRDRSQSPVSADQPQEGTSDVLSDPEEEEEEERRTNDNTPNHTAEETGQDPDEETEKRTVGIPIPN